MELETSGKTRPRNVDWKRAAALLYGDWGTSKAYVPGIAFAVAAAYIGSSYGSFWIVLPVSLLTLLVGINYIWVCRYFPEGGGVYSSAKAHSRHLALIGGFLLVADYIVTASLSCFEAFVYFDCSYEDAKRWAIITIFIIGVLNFFGPRHAGTIAVGFAIATAAVVGVLGIVAATHIPEAIANVQRPQGGVWPWWVAFSGAILALSGVEAVANMTGVMQLDPGSSTAKPEVGRTARKAILPVMIEVVLLTTVLGLAMHAIPGMGAKEHEGDMLRHMADVFVDGPARNVGWLSWVGENQLFSHIVGLVLGGLLLSATNTAIIALVSVFYLMAKDGELPAPFAMLNRFGVPWIMMLIAILAPILVIDFQATSDAVHGLASLYAIGVVGAISVNLGSCAFNFQLPMRRHQRGIMTLTFLIMIAIWVTIAFSKPWAFIFALTVVGLGFLGRMMHKGAPSFFRSGMLGRLLGGPDIDQESKRTAQLVSVQKQLGPDRPVTAIMVSSRGVTPTLRFAVDEARRRNALLYVLFVREVFTTIPVAQREEDDPEAQAVFAAVKSIAGEVEVTTIYAVSDDPSWTILDNAAIAGVDMLILGHSRRMALTRLLRGDLLHMIGMHLPEEIRLVIFG
jgi:amino acid transporter